MFIALNEAIDEAARDSEVRVIIFGGVGNHFCSGFDACDQDMVYQAIFYLDSLQA